MSKKKTKQPKTAGSSALSRSSTETSESQNSSPINEVEEVSKVQQFIKTADTVETGPATAQKKKKLKAAAPAAPIQPEPPVPIAAQPTEAVTAERHESMEVESSSSDTSSEDESGSEEGPEAEEVPATGLQLLSLDTPAQSPAKPPVKKPRVAMTQAQVDARTKKAFAHKIDTKEPLLDYPLDKIKSSFVNKSFWHHSGAIIRFFNADVPDVPQEVGILRLKAAKPEHIPAILSREKNKIKAGAIFQVKAALKDCCHNNGEDPRLTIEEWTCRFVVTSLSEYGRRMLGPDAEPGLWVLHCPEFYEEAIGTRYDDGSVDKFVMMKMYVNVVKPAVRIRKVEGGWIQEDPPKDSEDKRKLPIRGPYDRPRYYDRQFDRPFDRSYDNRPFDKRPRPSYDQDKHEIAKEVADILTLRTVKETGSGFPGLPSSKNPEAINSMIWPETDIPNISSQL